ncbi:hypothetical protein [Candidatus Leptofilum sp.]|uniref:hypothetical protein n=1 Tax=Candidatus Leptofilum sp. TaxID=3241576 RepID=UPI003B59FABA
MKFVGWFGIAVGLLMLGQWGFFLVAGQVPELETEPLRLYFHLAAEGLTAVALLVGGISLLQKRPSGKTIYLVAAGMLLYSVIVSPGYFAQQGQWGFVTMFAALLLLTLGSIFHLWRNLRNRTV